MSTPAPSPVTPPNTATPALLPRVEDHPRVRAATATTVRLSDEVRRLEADLSEHQERATEARAAALDIPRRLVAGESLRDVRQLSQDSVFERIHCDLRNARRALDLARKEQIRAELDAARELATKYAPEFRRRMRPFALAYVEFAQAMAEYRAFVDDLRTHELLTGPCSALLPMFAADDPTSDDGRFPQLMRDLIDAGVLDDREDADLLHGLPVAPKYVAPPPPPPPRPKNPTEEGRAFGRVLRRLGVQFGVGAES